MSDRQAETPTILLLEEDDETRPLLVENLRQQGYRVIVTVDRETAIAWISNTTRHFDIFLINQVGLSLTEYLTSIQSIYQHAGLSQDIPAIVLAEHCEEHLLGKIVKINLNRYVVYLNDFQQLLDFLSYLFFDKKLK